MQPNLPNVVTVSKTYCKICGMVFTLLSELLKGPAFTHPFKSHFYDALDVHVGFRYPLV